MPALLTHAVQPIPVLVSVKLEDGRIEQRPSWGEGMDVDRGVHPPARRVCGLVARGRRHPCGM